MAQWRPTRRFWAAYKGLHGDNAELDIAQPKKEKKEPSRANLKVPNEQQEQFWFVAWLKRNEVRHYHVPNGGFRNAIEAAKFKRLGVSAGVPDICIPYARKGRHGLYIELKRVSGGKLSESQVEWGEFLKSQGYAWHEAKGAREAIRLTCEYLDIKETGKHEIESTVHHPSKT